MTQAAAPPALFDRQARAQRRERAARAGRFQETGYLREAAAESIVDRLSATPRPFPDAAILGAGDGDVARALVSAGGFGIQRLVQVEASPTLAAPIGAQVADPVDAPLEPGAHDLIVHMLELHAVDDPIGALARARIALRPDGLLIAAMFCGDSLAELRAEWAGAEIETLGGVSPRVAPMAELRDLGGALQRAGFALPVADVERLEIWHDDAFSAMRDLRAMGETNAMRDRRRAPTTRRTAFDVARRMAERHARADGKIRTTVEIGFLTGWSPAASQPQPLRPGSARARLADALGVPEQDPEARE